MKTIPSLPGEGDMTSICLACLGLWCRERMPFSKLKGRRQDGKCVLCGKDGGIFPCACDLRQCAECPHRLSVHFYGERSKMTYCLACLENNGECVTDSLNPSAVDTTKCHCGKPRAEIHTHFKIDPEQPVQRGGMMD